MLNRTESSIENIPIKLIDFQDRYYSISPFPFNDERLFASIKAVGVTTPIHLEKRPDENFRIISGFKRVAASLELQISKVPAVIAKCGASLSSFWQTALENYGTRELHDLEKAEIIRKLAEIHLVGETDLLTVYLPALGLKESRWELERMFKLAGLGESLKKSCINEGLLCPTALAIRGWPESEQQIFTELISRLRLGTNKQKQLLRLVEDLKRLRKSSLASLWNDLGLDVDGEESPKLSFEEIHARLSRWRYPVLAEHEARWTLLKERLQLRNDIKLQAPRYFDGDRLTVSFSVTDPAELRERAQELLNAADKKELEEIFSLL